MNVKLWITTACIWMVVGAFWADTAFSQDKTPSPPPRLVERTFQKGDVRYYGNFTVLQFKMPKEAGGSSRVHLQVKMYLVARWEVKSVDDKGRATIECNFQRIYLYRWLSGMSFQYDTGKKVDKENPLVQILDRAFRPALGKSYTLVMTKQGDISQVKGTRKLMKKVVKSLPPAYRAYFKDSLFRFFNREAQQNMWQRAHIPMPAKKLSPGDQWTGTLPVDMLGAKVDHTYVYRGLAKWKGKTYIKIEVNCKYRRAKEGKGYGGFYLTKGTGRGYYYLDLNGWLVNTKITTNCSVTQVSDNANFVGREMVQTAKVKGVKK